jgi:type I restriction enzyme, S subunit
MANSWRSAPLPDGWCPDLLVDRVALPSGQVNPSFEPHRSKVLVAPDHIESGTGRLIAKVTAAEQGAISGKYSFEPGDVIYSKIRPYLRKAVRADFHGLCSADMYPLRPLPGVHPGFLHALVLGEHFSRFAEIVSMRSGFPKINRDELKEYTAAFPAFPEQARISEALDAIDEANHRAGQVISKLEQMRQGLLHDLLTRGLDGNGLAGTTPRRRCEFLQLRLSDVLSPVREPGRLGLPVMSVTIDAGLVKRDPAERRVLTRLTAQQHLLVRRGDIAYNMMRMWQGACGLAERDCLVSPAYVVLRLDAQLVPAFAYLLFKSPELIAAFLKNSRGLTSDRFRLYPDDLLRIRVTIPRDVEIQKKIANRVSGLDDSIGREREYVSKLHALKKGLMDDLLTGRVRATVPEEPD